MLVVHHHESAERMQDATQELTADPERAGVQLLRVAALSETRRRLAEGHGRVFVIPEGRMANEETSKKIRDLTDQIREKAVQLSDLEIVLEDYGRERRELLREIGQLKASLWELSAEGSLPARAPRSNPSPNSIGDQATA